MHLFSQPDNLSKTDIQNYRNVQIDAIGVGLANAAAPFLPVFLTHLDATSFQVSLLSSMPAFTGLLLSIPLGRFLQRQTNIVKWFSFARLFVISCYFFSGLVSFFLPDNMVIAAILAIWAIATIPQTIVSICFSVVMNAVAGPNGRFDLMSRRWSTMGITTTICVLAFGQLLDRVVFPLNYQIMFLTLAFGGLLSFYYSSHILLKPVPPPPLQFENSSFKSQVKEYKNLILKEKPYLSFISKRFIFLSGTTLSAPLIPLYLVRAVKATDGWISIINTSQIAIMVIGYFIWTKQSRRHGSRNVLLWSTFGSSIYPLALALTHSTWQISIFAGITGIFLAGVDLVFFDELMSKVPVEYSAIFVSFAQSIQYLSSVFAPMIGSAIGDTWGLEVGLIIAAILRFTGFLLFLLPEKRKMHPKTV